MVFFNPCIYMLKMFNIKWRKEKKQSLCVKCEVPTLNLPFSVDDLASQDFNCIYLFLGKVPVQRFGNAEQLWSQKVTRSRDEVLPKGLAGAILNTMDWQTLTQNSKFCTSCPLFRTLLESVENKILLFLCNFIFRKKGKMSGCGDGKVASQERV